MSFLNLLKKQDKGAGDAAVNTSVPPTDIVLSLKNQGYENSKIVETLQTKGYNADLIHDAINQAEVKAGVEGSSQDYGPPDMSGNQGFDNPGDYPMDDSSMQQPNGYDDGYDNNYDNTGNNMQNNYSPDESAGYPNMSQGMPQDNFQDPQFPVNLNLNNQNSPQGMMTDGYPNQNMQMQNNFPNNQSQMPGMQQGFGQDMNTGYNPEDEIAAKAKEEEFIERIEEIAEAIVDEKWNEVVKTINKIIDWKDRMETKIDRLDQQFVDLKDDFKSLSNSVIGKVGEYDKNISKIGVEIQAMEKVFQKVLPSLTENIHELQRITDKVKEKEK